ncbi:hypothetical protein BV25DRAFT_1872246 [Artomyces pyxidatus]|uniref:Uncharacterized protein n=1 Tax=Artomyces pyxidatus TaxID=48021 RepID=A0ACB8SPW0_9AGAM|nr:hypothetical protein BV25DRAFT_1872246 [Artomyces pyxidatus]
MLLSESKAIVDPAGRIIVYLAGRPSGDASWDACASKASRALTKAGDDCARDFKKKQKQHQRGRYAILQTGYQHGGGPTEPYNVGKKTVKQEKALQMLKSCKAFSRIAGFGSSALQMAAPRVFERYRDALGKIEAANPRLTKPFANSVYPTATFNLGPRTITLPHRDRQNVPYGWCAVTALGNYDPEKGGHIYLWELKMVIQFPPGSTILLPSALITHGNTPIQPGETRQSFTQYCAGSLMRWHAYGHRSAGALASEDPALARFLKDTAEQRRLAAAALFSKHSNLAEDHAELAAPSRC